jgi:hypothetical protein
LIVPSLLCGWPRPGQAVQFGSDGGSFGRADPFEDFPRLPQACDRVGSAASR